MKGQARKSLWIETYCLHAIKQSKAGQARKSLWIETVEKFITYLNGDGQARKSLWIETACIFQYTIKAWVRLVRACGSKRTDKHVWR